MDYTDPKPMILGEGVLNWPRFERVSDRYGLVNLDSGNVQIDGPPPQTRGRLAAIILETRPSSHIGDIFAGHAPSEPETGEEITLGEGTLFRGAYGSVGLEPYDGRETNWLDPKALYRCHSQTVRLVFYPKTPA